MSCFVGCARSPNSDNGNAVARKRTLPFAFDRYGSTEPSLENQGRTP